MTRCLWVVVFGAVVAVGGCAGHGSGGDPIGYVNADGIRGGQLYDKFWATETGWNQADPNLPTYNAHPDFFRCKQCHGWDLLGRKGGYISRAPTTTRPNVASVDLWASAQTRTPQELFDRLKASNGRRSVTAVLSTYDPDTNPTVGDQMPDYGAIFTDAQIWDVVRFLKDEAVDVASLYDAATAGAYPTGTITFSHLGKNGDATHGSALFAAKCAGCHGADGAAILVDGGAYTVGSHLRAKPYEDQHKIKFGQLGSTMGSQVIDDDDIKDLYRALRSPATYPDPD